MAAQYNAAADLIGRNLHERRSRRTAFIDDHGQYTHGQLGERVHRAAHAFRWLGLERGDRLVLCLLDTIDFPTCFLGAIEAGIIAVPLNTFATDDDYAWVLTDSQARGAVVSAARLPVFEQAAANAGWSGLLIVSGDGGTGTRSLESQLAGGFAEPVVAPTTADDPCFWLYSSGSTGRPKAAIHRHISMRRTAELFAVQTLGMTDRDTVYSASKLFFAYGLGNSLSFPLFTGAVCVLTAERSTPETVSDLLRRVRPTIFFGVPTLFNSLLARPDLPQGGQHALRFCVSAGEALPEATGQAWLARLGVDIVDGIGSTEMLHMFLSNKPGDVRYGTTGRPVPGYRTRIVDDRGAAVPLGQLGELLVKGPSAAAGYWNNPEKMRATFQEGWVRTGDKFRQKPDGDYVYCGRGDDMLKVAGQWVSPMEVESVLLTHDAVLEAAVVGAADAEGFTKPKAFVVLKATATPSPTLDDELKELVKAKLAPYKSPRWIEFVDALPKTATGKIQRFVLRSK